MCMCYMGLGFNGCFVIDATMFNWPVTIGRISLKAWATRC